MTRLTPEQIAEDARLAAIEAKFLSDHDVKRFKNSRHNLMLFLKAGGASRAEVNAVVDRIGNYGAHDGPFDHGRLYGRDGKPTMLVGHPYGLQTRDLQLIRDIRRLGFTVNTNGESFYGFTTTQVLVTLRPNDPTVKLRRKLVAVYGPEAERARLMKSVDSILEACNYSTDFDTPPAF